MERLIDGLVLIATGLVIGMWLGCTACQAEEIPYRYYEAPGVDSACPAFWNASRNDVFAFYDKEFNIKFVEVPSKKRHGRQLEAIPASYENWQTVFHQYEALTKITPGTITVVTAPPIKMYGRRGIGGLANYESLWTKPFLVVFTTGGIHASAVVFAHELGHVLGLRHRPDRVCSFMSLRALFCRKLDWRVTSRMRAKVKEVLYGK